MVRYCAVEKFHPSRDLGEPFCRYPITSTPPTTRPPSSNIITAKCTNDFEDAQTILSRKVGVCRQACPREPGILTGPSRVPPSDDDGFGGCLTGPEGHCIRKNAPVCLPTRVVSCLKSASFSVCIFHNSLAGIFRREDSSRDKRTLLYEAPFFLFFPLFPLLFSGGGLPPRGYKQKPLNCFSFVKNFFSRFQRATSDHLALRRSNSIMASLLRNKEKKYVKSIQVRENMGMFARNTLKGDGRRIRSAEIKARMPRYLSYSWSCNSYRGFHVVSTVENGKPSDFHRPSADNVVIIVSAD